MTDDKEPMSGPVRRQHGAGTYQMLWDCRFCGTEKLLGVTHRHCPNCGAAQDPAWRYFPAEDDMVALENHQYVGVDVMCPACNQPNSAANTYCSECGADLATGQKAALHQDVELGEGGLAFATQRDVVAESWQAEMQRVGAAPAAEGFFSRHKRAVIVGVGLLLALCVAGIIFAVTYRQDASGSVTALEWERVVHIEKFGPVSGSGWQDQVPGDAYGRSCTTRQRGSRQVQTGSREECRNVDQGDGSFRRECRSVPTYRDEPVYDQWCTYTVDRWSRHRDVKAEGVGKVPAPDWPAVQLASGSGRYGQERIADRTEKYTVRIKESDGDDHHCSFGNQDRWAQYAVGDAVGFKVGLAGGIDCDALRLSAE